MHAKYIIIILYTESGLITGHGWWRIKKQSLWCRLLKALKISLKILSLHFGTSPEMSYCSLVTFWKQIRWDLGNATLRIHPVFIFCTLKIHIVARLSLNVHQNTTHIFPSQSLGNEGESSCSINLGDLIQDGVQQWVNSMISLPSKR